MNTRRCYLCDSYQTRDAVEKVPICDSCAAQFHIQHESCITYDVEYGDLTVVPDSDESRVGIGYNEYAD